MDYTVSGSDTIERIAALHDCTPSELMKFNHFPTRLIFPGQKIKIPPVQPPPPNQPLPSVHQITQCQDSSLFNPTRIENYELQRKSSEPPKKSSIFTSSSNKKVEKTRARRVSSERVSNGIPTAADNIPAGPGTAVRAPSNEAQLDAECFHKFLKLRVKHFTDHEGVVSGTLLVTPNCLMFDPDVTHPLVKENGPDPYGMVAPLEQIMSAALYKDVSAMTGEKPVEPYQPETERERSKSEGTNLVSLGQQSHSQLSEEQSEQHSMPPNLEISFNLDSTASERAVQTSGSAETSPKAALPCIAEEEFARMADGPGEPTVQRRHASESETTFVKSDLLAVAAAATQPIFRSCPSLEQEDDEGEFDVDAAGGLSSGERRMHMPLMFAQDKLGHTNSVPLSDRGFGTRKLAGLRRSLKTRATSISGSLTSGAQNVAGAVSSGAQNVAGAVSSGAQNVAGAVSSGAQNVAGAVSSGAQNVAAGLASGTKAAAEGLTSGAKAAAGAVVRAPQNIVNMGSGLFVDGEGGILDIQDSWFASDSDSNQPVSSPRRKQSVAKLKVLKAKSAQGSAINLA